MRARRAPALAVALLVSALAAAGLHAQPDPVQPVRESYLAAVQEEAAIARGLAQVEAARATVRPGSEEEVALLAYHGALVTLRAKHATWPATRLRHLRGGLAVLDEVVRAHPAHVEARYLRLMSCYYLPGILGRGWSVREDFAALARLLPGARGRYPPELYATLVRFVLENGRPGPEDRARLQAALADG